MFYLIVSSTFKKYESTYVNEISAKQNKGQDESLTAVSNKIFFILLVIYQYLYDMLRLFHTFHVVYDKIWER